MKHFRFLSAILALLILISSATIFVSADTEDPEEEPYLDDFELIFSDDCPPEIRERILAKYYGTDDPIMTPFGLMCTVFGHKFYYIEGVAEKTYHRYYTAQPRCRTEKLGNEYCERCSYDREYCVSFIRFPCCT